MRTGLILLFIAVIGFAIYSNSLGGDFIWDDVAAVLYNDYIKDPELVPEYFSAGEAMAKGSLGGVNYRPFFVLSLAADYYFSRLNPLGYHITNVFLHVANAALIFFLAAILIKNRTAAFFASLIFLTHPVQTESVAWISGRADVLFLFFYLSSFIAYIRFRENGRFLFYIFSFICFLFSLLSKEMAASLPFLLILRDVFFSKTKRFLRNLTGYLPFFGALIFYVMLRYAVLGKFAQCDYWAGSVYETMLSMARGVIYYIRLLIFPAGLTADYLTFPLVKSLKDPAGFLSITAIFLILALAAALFRKRRLESFLIFAFFVTLLPVSNIIPIQILIAERFLYLPCAWYAMLVACVFLYLRKRLPETGAAAGYPANMTPGFRPGGLYFLAGALIFTYSFLTMQRNRDWQDPVAFNKSTVKNFPDNYRAHLNLSVAYYNAGELEKSYRSAKSALEAAPEEYPSARRMLGFYYMRAQKTEKAVSEFKKILEENPLDTAAFISLGNAYAAAGKHDAARRAYKKALALEPQSSEAAIALSALYYITGDLDSSIRQLQKAVSVGAREHERARRAAAYLRLGELYLEKGDREKAQDCWRGVYRDFKDPAWFNDIAGFLTGAIGEREFLEMARKRQPGLRVFYYYYAGLGNEAAGDKKSAAYFYREAAELAAPASQEMRMLAKKRLDELEGD